MDYTVGYCLDCRVDCCMGYLDCMADYWMGCLDCKVDYCIDCYNCYYYLDTIYI